MINPGTIKKDCIDLGATSKTITPPTRIKYYC